MPEKQSFNVDEAIDQVLQQGELGSLVGDLGAGSVKLDRTAFFSDGLLFAELHASLEIFEHFVDGGAVDGSEGVVHAERTLV